jgi:threonine dehydratase
MCLSGTPLERHEELGLWVKREDLCCPGGPNFSKTRGVYAHINHRKEGTIGVLDTSHSQGGWAVARACYLLGKRCVLYHPVRKSEIEFPLKPQQVAARELGAELVPLPAGRSAILYHKAKKDLAEESDTYMMPNALKLIESVDETAKEFCITPMPNDVDTILVSASSGTIAAGVLRGALMTRWPGAILVHLGYSRPERAVCHYIQRMASASTRKIRVIDELYNYADEAKPGPTPEFPCNEFYDLKAFRWWMEHGKKLHGECLFWNIG